MSTPPAEDAQRQFDRARALMDQGRNSVVEAQKILSDLLPTIRNARARGQVNQMIWECFRLAGQRSQFFSQAGQDAFLDQRVFQGKRDGRFVEIGGFDGISGSNCLFFELMRGWSGMLIEPAPTHFAQAQSFRRATCLQVALAGEEGEAEFLEIQEGYSQMSGLTGSYDAGLRRKVEDDPRHKGALIKVKTQTLSHILDSQGWETVDYISLDVEGGEMQVLQSFPFDRYRVEAWTIENNTADKKVPDLMHQKGYHRIEALGVDDIYVLDDR